VEETNTQPAFVPLNAIVTPVQVVKPVPSIVTDVPIGPVVGEKLVNVIEANAGDAIAAIAASAASVAVNVLLDLRARMPNRTLNVMTLLHQPGTGPNLSWQAACVQLSVDPNGTAWA
jgi:hypothetical protein